MKIKRERVREIIEEELSKLDKKRIQMSAKSKLNQIGGVHQDSKQFAGMMRGAAADAVNAAGGRLDDKDLPDEEILAVLKDAGIDVVVTTGGDDGIVDTSLIGAERSRQAGSSVSEGRGKIKITRSQIIQLIKEELGRLNESDLPEGYQDPLTNVGDDYSDMKFEDIRDLFKNTRALDMLMTPQEMYGRVIGPRATGRFLVLRRSDHADLDTDEFKQLQKDKGAEKNFMKIKTFFFVKDGEKYYIVLEEM